MHENLNKLKTLVSVHIHIYTTPKIKHIKVTNINDTSILSSLPETRMEAGSGGGGRRSTANNRRLVGIRDLFRTPETGLLY